MNKHINEELHIPDIDNVTDCIEEIVYVFKCALFNKIIDKLENNDFTDTFDVNISLYLRSFSYIPEWLDNKNEFNVLVYLRKVSDNTIRNNKFEGIFSYNGDEIILPNDDCDEFPTRLCNCNFGIECKNYQYSDIFDIDNMFVEMKEAIRHEFEHAYEKYKNLSSSSLYEYDKIISEKQTYDLSYNNITDIINHNKCNNEYEFEFLKMLYNLVYTERHANIAGFFDDVKANQEKYITDFEQYSKYKKYISFIDSVDKNVYEKYKEDIINLFGISGKKFNSFKNKLIKCCNDTLKRMQDVFYKAKVYNKENVLKDKLKSLNNRYNELKQCLASNMSGNSSESAYNNYLTNINLYIFKGFEIITASIIKSI